MKIKDTRTNEEIFQNITKNYHEGKKNIHTIFITLIFLMILSLLTGNQSIIITTMAAILLFIFFDVLLEVAYKIACWTHKK